MVGEARVIVGKRVGALTSVLFVLPTSMAFGISGIGVGLFAEALIDGTIMVAFVFLSFSSSTITGETFLNVTCFCSFSARRMIACIATFCRGFLAHGREFASMPHVSAMFTKESRFRSKEPCGLRIPWKTFRSIFKKKKRKEINV